MLPFVRVILEVTAVSLPCVPPQPPAESWLIENLAMFNDENRTPLSVSSELFWYAATAPLLKVSLSVV